VLTIPFNLLLPTMMGPIMMQINLIVIQIHNFYRTSKLLFISHKALLLKYLLIKEVSNKTMVIILKILWKRSIKTTLKHTHKCWIIQLMLQLIKWLCKWLNSNTILNNSSNSNLMMECPNPLGLVPYLQSNSKKQLKHKIIK
jgi:hypothetical protein